MFGNHLKRVRKLMEIQRYQNRFCFKRRSVAEHSYSVAKIAEGLAIWEISKFDNQVDMGRLLQKAINHDIIEVETGDILGPSKRKVPHMKQAIKDLEEIMYYESIEPELPRSWRPIFKSNILEPKSNDIEGELLAAADIIDTIIESIEEIHLGNKEFENILRLSASLLLECELNSVKYFIKYALNDFGLDIRKYYGNVFYEYQNSLVFDDSVFEKEYKKNVLEY